VATRYDKLTVRYEAIVQIAAINEWLLPTSMQTLGCEAGRVLPVGTGQPDFRATLRSAGTQEQLDSVSDVFGDKASTKAA
jgi:hypothetical protein